MTDLLAIGTRKGLWLARSDDARRRGEAGDVRRFVDVYVDGEDVRWQGGVAAPVPDGAVVQVLPSVAGG